MINILGLMILAGLVALLGDVLGRKMGRKRLTILHLRPKTTATLGTVLMGMFITVVTIGIFALLNQNVYDALFRVQKLKNEIYGYQNEVTELRKDLQNLSDAKQQLTETKERLTGMIDQYVEEKKALKEQVTDLRGRLLSLEEQLGSLEKQLKQREDEYNKLETTNEGLKESIEELRLRVTSLSEERDRRIAEIQQLRKDIEKKERAHLVFRAGAPIIERVIAPKNGAEEAIGQVRTIVEDVHSLARSRGAEIRDFPKFWADNEEKLKVLAVKLAEEYAKARTSIVVGVISAENIFKGDQLVVEIKWLHNELLHEKGKDLWSFRIDAGKAREAIVSLVEYEINRFGEEAYKKGRLSTSPGVDRLVIFDAVNEIHEFATAVDVVIIAADNIYVSGPVKIAFSLTPVEEEPLFTEPSGVTVEIGHEALLGSTLEADAPVGSTLEPHTSHPAETGFNETAPLTAEAVPAEEVTVESDNPELPSLPETGSVVGEDNTP